MFVQLQDTKMGIQLKILCLFICLPKVVLCQNRVGPSDTVVEDGTLAQLTCSDTDGISTNFDWYDTSVNPNVQVYSSATGLINPATKYTNFGVNISDPSTSVLEISDVQVTDEGSYQCYIPAEFTNVGVAAVLTVEVKSTLTFTWVNTRVDNSTISSRCDAVGGRPQESISWYINGQEITAGITETSSPNQQDSDLTDTSSELAYPPATDHTSISCNTTGHAANLQHLNQRDENELSAPTSVSVDISSDGMTVTCNIPAGEEGNPPTSYYYITGGSLVFESFTGVNSATNSEAPSTDTNYTCVAGNYIGNVTATEPYSIPPSTASIPTTQTPEGTTVTTTIGDPGSTPSDAPSGTPKAKADPQESGGGGANVGAIAGGVCAGIVVVGGVVIIIIFVKRDKEKGRGKPHRDPPRNSNKSAPQAAPRNMQVKHTVTEAGDEYAMVDKKGPGGGGGDHSDAGTNGKGKTDPGLLYADLDHTGHTDQHVPQNPAEVTVYSSIVV